MPGLQLGSGETPKSQTPAQRKIPAGTLLGARQPAQANIASRFSLACNNPKSSGLDQNSL